MSAKVNGKIMTTTQANFNEAIAIFDDIYWVGFYDSGSGLHCNPYLLIDEEDVVLFDPGSIPHFPDVMTKIIDVVSPEDITAIVVHHQDPDVCGNTAIVEDTIDRSDLKLVTQSNNKRLIEHLGVKSEFYLVDKHGYKLTLKSGRVLEFKSAAFLHSPFGIVTYDTKNKALFCSDIFGGMLSEWSLYSDGDFHTSMARWHQEIMPSNSILKSFLQNIRKWEIEAILPQHGSILRGDDVAAAFDFLTTLPCAMDLMQEEADEG